MDRNDAWNETKVRPKGCDERAGNTHGMLVLGDTRREIVAPKPVADETVAMHVSVENRKEGERYAAGCGGPSDSLSWPLCPAASEK